MNLLNLHCFEYIYIYICISISDLQELIVGLISGFVQELCNFSHMKQKPIIHARSDLTQASSDLTKH